MREGQSYHAEVVRLSAYGATLRLPSGEEATLPKGELADHRFDGMEDIIEVGRDVYVRCTGFDQNGNPRFSRREALLNP